MSSSPPPYGPSSSPQAGASWPPPLPHPEVAPPPPPRKLKGILGALLIGLAIAVKFFGKLKFAILPLFKFLPVLLKTGGTMLLSIWAYALFWGWKFALGFVLLIFVHEGGHLIAARRLGLNVGAPVFIPFMGAFIALRDAPKNAWIESVVGIGGPVAGTIGAAVCHFIFLAFDQPLFGALAYTGYLLNLFNLVPVGQMDGGHIATALSPWLWVLGYIAMGWLLWMQPYSIIIWLVVLLGLPRLISLFRARSPEEARYFEVTRAQRGLMAVSFFGLIGLLALGMHMAQSEMKLRWGD
ncbi:MAG: site-2 protease family protein [Verrucomicrobiales bacterium]